MLAFVRHVDEIVKALTFGIALNERPELIFVKPDQLTNGLGERRASKSSFAC
jgi:hypothetical protein